MSFIKKSVISSAFTYLGVAIGYFNLMWLFPKVLSTEQIGLLGIVQDTAVLLSPLAGAGFRQSTLKFFPHFREDRARHKLFLTFILLCTAVAYILFLLLFFGLQDTFAQIFEEKAAAFISYFKIMLALVLIMVLTGIMEAYSHSLLKVIFPNFLKEISTRFLLTVSASLYALGFISFETLLNSLLFIYLTGLLLLVLYLMQMKEIGISLNFRKIPWRTYRRIIYYSSFSILSSISTRLSNKVDSLMITSLLGLSELGVYRIVFYIGVVIEMPRRAIVQLSIPLVSASFKKARIREIKSLYQKISLNQLIIGYLFLIGIWANANNLFYMMPNGETFQNGKYVILIIGIAKVLDMTASINGEIIVMSKYFRFNLIAITGMAISTIAFNYLLIPLMGMNGAALSVLISLFLFNLAKYIFVLAKLKIQPLTIRTLYVLIIGAVIYFLSTFIPQFNNALIDLFIRSAFIASLYALAIIYFKISEEVNGVYKEVMAKARGFLK